MNVYYIGLMPLDLKKVLEIESYIVGIISEQRKLKDGSYLVKTPIGVKETPSCLKDWQRFESVEAVNQYIKDNNLEAGIFDSLK